MIDYLITALILVAFVGLVLIVNYVLAVQAVWLMKLLGVM